MVKEAKSEGVAWNSFAQDTDMCWGCVGRARESIIGLQYTTENVLTTEA